MVQQKPVPTPHPARGAAEQAVYLYPDLGVPDSHFRRTFDEIYEDQRLNNPQSLTKVDWPLTLARRTAAMLSVGVARPVAEATPTPRANPLERGAYDQRRNVARPPYVRGAPYYQDQYRYQY